MSSQPFTEEKRIVAHSSPSLSVQQAVLSAAKALYTPFCRNDAEFSSAQLYDLRILAAHPAYSKCMHELYRHKDTAPGGSGMVDECRSLCKGYWTLVALRNELRPPLSELRRSKLEAQHKRFKALFDDDKDEYEAEYYLSFTKGK